MLKTEHGERREKAPEERKGRREKTAQVGIRVSPYDGTCPYSPLNRARERER